MRLNIVPIMSNKFTVLNKPNGVVELVAEISDFGPNFRFQCLYDDAIDVGLAVVSLRTSAVVHYYLHGVEYDGDGDIQFWTLKPTTESVRQFPNCQNTIVTIFND